MFWQPFTGSPDRYIRSLLPACAFPSPAYGGCGLYGVRRLPTSPQVPNYRIMNTSESNGRASPPARPTTK